MKLFEALYDACDSNGDGVMDLQVLINTCIIGIEYCF